MYCLLITRSNDRFSSGLSPVFFLDAPFPRLRFRQRAEELGEYRGLRETQLGGDRGDAHVRPLHQFLSFEEKVAVAPFHRRHAADGEDGAPELAGLELHYAGVFAGVHPAVLADEIGEEIDQVVARGAVAVEVGRDAHPKLFFGGFTLEDGDKDIFRGDSLECFFHDDMF